MLSVKDFISSGMVRRFHTSPINTTQTNGHHQWSVAVILAMICEPSTNLLLAALTHDMAEFQTGDMPAPMKWKYPLIAKEVGRVEHDVLRHMGLVSWLDALSPEEQQLLSLADSLDAMIFGYHLILTGNDWGAELFCKMFYTLRDNNVDKCKKAVIMMNEMIMDMQDHPIAGQQVRNMTAMRHVDIKPNQQ